LGMIEEHMVYKAEIVGMILAVQILKEERGQRGGTMSLGVNNQAVIQATITFQSQPGHYLVDKTLTSKDNNQLIIRWSPGHVGIKGNEAADKEAKKAALGDLSSAQELPKSLQ
ncbi:uncharacterized protein EDB93DRAFT_1062896, partial [Suillus bovinus]|uniref:uncharacterized protein n=1 Tax=Suillus bovinus TaxID=48563 RepID=UPI001B874120